MHLFPMSSFIFVVFIVTFHLMERSWSKLLIYKTKREKRWWKSASLPYSFRALIHTARPLCHLILSHWTTWYYFIQSAQGTRVLSRWPVSALAHFCPRLFSGKSSTATTRWQMSIWVNMKLSDRSRSLFLTAYIFKMTHGGRCVSEEEKEN